MYRARFTNAEYADVCQDDKSAEVKYRVGAQVKKGSGFIETWSSFSRSLLLPTVSAENDVQDSHEENKHPLPNDSDICDFHRSGVTGPLNIRFAKKLPHETDHDRILISVDYSLDKIKFKAMPRRPKVFSTV